jgi:Ribbon-helix-helix protein, copG family
VNFNVYLDEETGELLAKAAEQSGQSRNALIRRAVSEWLSRGGKPEWPSEVLSFNGQPDMEPFEHGRKRLKSPGADPLA